MTESASPENNFAAQLAALNALFAAQLGGTLDEMNAMVEGVGPDVQSALLQDLHTRLHKLAGSGGTFGFPDLSTQSRTLEVRVKAWLDSATAPTLTEWQTWQTDLHALRQTIGAPVAALIEALPTLPQDKSVKAIRVVLIEDDTNFGTGLKLGLSQFGYEVAHFTGFATAEPAILTNPPDILVVDIMLPGQTPSEGSQAIPLLFERLGHRLPTIFLTARADFSARIAAAGAGGDAFFLKPVDAPSVAARIEELLSEGEKSPYRVLIIDDDEVLAEHYRLALSSAGLLAEKISQPQDALTVMQHLNPDLILMDLYMPGCSGADLARAIRYDPAWESIPIIYLSAETDLNAQIKAMDSGADDFLTKPISTQKLLGTVRARARRARKVAELMSQDSLTGLLKHASIKERLAQEVDRATRQNTPLSVVMVDIDFFKKVNDNWGHPVGDQVIKTLGHLLRQRLRRQDIVGRYGGEEFAAVLPNCPINDAVRLIDDIRQRFAEVRFMQQGQSFGVTLSAGIASIDHYPDAPGLLAAADAALYVAKHGGRNQVQAAKST